MLILRFHHLLLYQAQTSPPPFLGGDLLCRIEEPMHFTYAFTVLCLHCIFPQKCPRQLMLKKQLTETRVTILQMIKLVKDKQILFLKKPQQQLNL